MMKIAEMFGREVDRRVGHDATFEQWQEGASAFATEVLSNLLHKAEGYIFMWHFADTG